MALFARDLIPTLTRTPHRDAEAIDPGPAWIRNTLIGLIVLGVLARLALVHVMPPDQGWMDGGQYHTLAANLLSGHGFTMDAEPPFAPTRVRPPGYPVFLAAVYALLGPSPAAAAAAQSALGGITIFFAFAIGRRLFDCRTGLFAAAALTFYPALVHYDTRILREGLTVFLFTASVLAALRHRHGHGSRRSLTLLGILFGCLTLCRPELLTTLPFMGLLAVGTRPIRARLTEGALILAGCTLLWMPWTLRNVYHFGSISPQAQGISSAIWFGNRWAEAGGDDATDVNRQALRDRTASIYAGNTMEEANQRFSAEAERDLIQAPIWFVKMTGRKMWMFWEDAIGVRNTLPGIHPALASVVNTGYYLLLALAVYALYRLRNDARVRALAGLIVTFWMTYALLHVRNRYRVPLLPLMFVMSGGGFWMLWDLIKESTRPLVRPTDPSPTH